MHRQVAAVRPSERRRFRRMLFVGAELITAGVAGACSYVPPFDVPQDQYGLPTARSIVDRVKCEIVAMVRDDVPEDQRYPHRLFLRNNDYDIEANLSLDVNDTGGLAPTVSAITPITAIMTAT